MWCTWQQWSKYNTTSYWAGRRRYHTSRARVTSRSCQGKALHPCTLPAINLKAILVSNRSVSIHLWHKEDASKFFQTFFQTFFHPHRPQIWLQDEFQFLARTDFPKQELPAKGRAKGNERARETFLRELISGASPTPPISPAHRPSSRRAHLARAAPAPVAVRWRSRASIGRRVMQSASSGGRFREQKRNSTLCQPADSTSNMQSALSKGSSAAPDEIPEHPWTDETHTNSAQPGRSSH